MKTAVALALCTLAATARADDPDDHPMRELGIGLHAPSMMHVGAWRALDLGFAALAGVKLDRVAVLAEGDLRALWPARWSHGEVIAPGTQQDVEGSEQRLGVLARVVVLRHRGAWSSRGGLSERGSHELYLDAGLGLERLAIDGEPARSRPDLQLGAGYLMGAREAGRMQFHLFGFYALHVTVAGGVPTPTGVSSRAIAPAVSAPYDVGVSFDFGLLFGP